MNIVILSGRLTADPVIRRTQDGKTVANYTIAVDRPGKDQQADFIRCVAWEKRAEFAETYMTKGRKFVIEGRIQTGSYDDRDGKKVYTTEIIVNSQEFADSKPENAVSRQENAESRQQPQGGTGFMNIPDGLDEDLPFN